VTGAAKDRRLQASGFGKYEPTADSQQPTVQGEGFGKKEPQATSRKAGPRSGNDWLILERVAGSG
jgi:hypothetical protein